MPEDIPAQDSTGADQHRRWRPHVAHIVAVCGDTDDRDRCDTDVFTGLIPSCMLASHPHP